MNTIHGHKYIEERKKERHNKRYNKKTLDNIIVRFD